MLKWILGALIVFWALFAGGCSMLTQGSAVQTELRAVMDDVVGPAVAKAGDELSTRTAQLTGQVSAINPGYEVRGHAIMGTGIVYDLVVNAAGISANVAGATQADQGSDLSRHPINEGAE